MAIVRWEPFRDLLSTQDRFNRLFNDTFSRFFDEGDLGARTWAPPVDVYETDHDVVLKAELPGVDPTAVRIVAVDTTLVVSGVRERPHPTAARYHQVEIEYGPFERRIELAEDVDADAATATYEAGMLRLEVPLTQ